MSLREAKAVWKRTVFFFKQKTAYEIHRCLEFRRVLFRSPGIKSTVATSPPLANDATLFAARPSGIGTQPFHVSLGLAPEASTSNASIDSRAPCATA